MTDKLITEKDIEINEFGIPDGDGVIVSIFAKTKKEASAIKYQILENQLIVENCRNLAMEIDHAAEEEIGNSQVYYKLIHALRQGS